MAAASTSVHPRREPHRSRWVLAGALTLVVAGLTVALLYQLDVLGHSSPVPATEGSGVPARQARHLPPFGSVELAGVNEVLIRVGGKQSVVVHADRNLVDRVTTEVQSGKLVIGNTPGSFSTKSPMSVKVTVPTLRAVVLAGSGNIAVDGVKAERLAVSLPGSGMVTGSGKAKKLDVTVGGSGSVQLVPLHAKAVHALVSGSGSIAVTAAQTLDASVSGSGAILYRGRPPIVTKSVTGTGTIVGAVPRA